MRTAGNRPGTPSTRSCSCREPNCSFCANLHLGIGEHGRCCSRTGYAYDTFGRKPTFLTAVGLMSLGWLSLSMVRRKPSPPCTNRQLGCLRSVVAWCAQASSASSLVRGTVIIGLGHGLTSGIQSLTGSDFAPPAVCAPPLPRPPVCTRPGSRGYKGLTRRCLLAAGHDSVPRSVHVSDAGRGFREPAAAGEAGAGRICRHGDARGRRPRPCLRHDLPPARA